jgi:hypothetical protein
MLLSGLGSSTINGVGALVLDGEVQCLMELNINNNVETGGAVAWQFFLLFMVLALLVFLWRIFKMAMDSFDSYEHLYTQHAILDSAYNGPQSTSRSLSGLEDTI